MLKICNLIAGFESFQPDWIDMKIDFTKEEYRYLLDMVEIAEWVLNSHRTYPSDEIRVYSEVNQKILSYSKDLGF